jgi:aspartate racemase
MATPASHESPHSNPHNSGHIGIVGVSPEGAALFYREVSRQASALRAPDDQPRISIHNEPLGLYLAAIRRDDWHEVGRLLRRSAELLARCGATVCITPDHAVHHGVQLAEVGSTIPWLPAPEIVAQAVANDKRKRVGLIGTKLVCRSSTYQTHLGLRGIPVEVPTDDDADALDQVIFGELIFGQIRPESRLLVMSMIGRLATLGCDAIILACSEAPLLVTQENSALPVYEAGLILARAVVRPGPVPG